MTSTAKPAQRTCRLWATVILLPVLFACLSSCYHNSHRITAEGILKRTHTRDYVETEIHQNKAGTITGDTVVVAAGQGDINATGMHIVSDHGTMLHTDKGDINLKAGKNSYRSVEKHSKHKTGLMGSGGWGVFLGSRRQSGETELNIKAPAPTLVSAIDGNIHIQAGGHYDGTGALVHAGREGGPLTKEQWLQMSETERNRAGNIYFSAESGSLRAARGSQDHEMHSHYKQTGFTANLGGAVVNVAQTALQTMKTLSDGDNARVRTMNTLLVKRIRRSTADSRAQQACA